MMMSMDRAAWIDAFVMHLSHLGTRAAPEVLVEMAEWYFSSHRESDPVKVAQWHADRFGLVHDD
jgi:hypothetical protein